MPYSDELILDQLERIAILLESIGVLLTKQPAAPPQTAAATQRAVNEWLTPKEAAKYLGLAEITLAIWRSTGRYKLPWAKVGGQS